jgi:hypothetical protein
MAQLGLTPTAADLVLDALCGPVPLSFGMSALQLHDGLPGTGTSNVFAGATRSQAIYNAASGGSKTLATTPTFNITAATDVGQPVGYLSIWNGLTGDTSAIPWATGYIQVPQVLAEGDTVRVGTATIKLPDLAA